MKCCLTIDLNWSSSTNSLFVMQTVKSVSWSPNTWLKGNRFTNYEEFKILELEGRHVLKPFGLFQVVFKFFASFCPLSPPFLHPFNYNLQTLSIIFLRLFTYSEFLSHFYRAQYIKSNVEMQYIHKTIPFHIRFFNPFQKQ